MKRIIAAIAVILTLFVTGAFSGCGMVKDAADSVENAMTDVSDKVSEAASDMDDNGDVNDDDGIIGNGN